MSVVAYKCPNCDGELKFDPSSQKFACDYCGSGFTLAELKQHAPEEGAEKEKQPSSQKAESSAGEGGEANLFTCPNCGAQIVTGCTTAATECFYCHNPVVLSGRLSGEYLPKKIIPFKINREEAETRFREWLRKRKFVPRSFIGEKNLEKVTGVYFPYWMVDSDMHASLNATAEQVRRWRRGDIEYIETRYFELLREGNIHTGKILKNALSHANREVIDSVQPYDPSGIVDFSMPYLSGFQAEKRDIEREQLSQQVQQEFQNHATGMLRSTMSGYTNIRMLGGNSQILRENWNYTLLPVWTFVYHDRKKNKYYFYAMNGQTGNVYGKIPMDYKKLSLISCGIGAAVFALIMLLFPLVIL
ncbi:MAG TPA: TFIIB-type zinc ribbon-containing protein [Candidatus Onthovicinus excrementipullorum]|nr:TFIIB-type zinc ribbon-containing protein [Candidatus Onthovicinus excrementipullorum]